MWLYKIGWAALNGKRMVVKLAQDPRLILRYRIHGDWLGGGNKLMLTSLEVGTSPRSSGNRHKGPCIVGSRIRCFFDQKPLSAN